MYHGLCDKILFEYILKSGDAESNREDTKGWRRQQRYSHPRRALGHAAASNDSRLNHS
jgi:hypothetical protein